MVIPYMLATTNIPRNEGGILRDFTNAEEFDQFLIKEALISAVPWDDAGNFIRFSVTFEAEDQAEEERIISEVKNRLAEFDFIF
ncbi:MAG: hypothetical protein R6U46_11010 [Marinilabilia sp.]